MPITFNKEKQIFKLDTKTSSYVFGIAEKGFLEHFYYGKTLDDQSVRHLSNRQVYSFAAQYQGYKRDFALSTLLGEITSNNSSDFRDCSVSIVNSDKTLGNRFEYLSHQIKKGRSAIDGMPYSRADELTESLEVVAIDKEKQIQATLYYVVFPEQDVIARYLKITNKSQGDISLLKAGSMNLEFSRSDLDLVELIGINGYELADVQRSPLKKGIQGVKSSVGAVTHHVNPFFMLVEHTASEDYGEAYGFNLLYSSNFKSQIECDRLGTTRIITGINDDGFNFTLKSGEEFYTPEAIFTFSDKGMGQVSRNFHDHIREHIIPKQFAYAKRPIVVNSWEGNGFDVSEKLMDSLADGALAIGADMLVLDDGWFRNDTEHGLGDWELIKEKFPNGLNALSERLHQRGLKFGIWFEPESATIDSEFLKTKPDDILKTRNDPPVMRSQFIIDFTKDQNVKEIFDKMTAVLDGLKVEYLKWDYNRYVHEAGSKNCPYGEVYHRQMLGVYKLLEMLRNRYPDMMIEGCSGGGGRVDLGMAFYSPQIWLSDNTDPFARLYMQYHASYGYPTSMLSSHLTRGTHISKRPSDNEFRYLVASFGVYGYEFDLNDLTDSEKIELNGYSKEYSDTYRFSMDCDLYRIISPQDHLFEATIQVTKDKNQALFTFLEINSTGFYENILIRLKGLDENKRYKNCTTGEIYSGKTLMNAGIRIGNLFVKGGGSGFKTLYKAVD